MEESRATITLVAVGVYLLTCIVIGFWALRRTRSSEDYFMAGRSLGPFLTAFAIFASTMSGFGFVGGPGLVYAMGSSSIWILATSVVGVTIVIGTIAKRLRLLAELRGSISLPDVVAVRYDSRGVRAGVAVVVVLGVLGYLGTQILAMAIVVQDILQDAGVWTGISLEMAVVLSTSVLVFYTVTGGIIATIYTDFIQGVIMLVASVLVFVTVLGTFDGGMTEITTVIVEDDAGSMGAFGTLGMMGALSWFFLFSIGVGGQPHVVTKYMMLERVRDIRYVVPLSVFGYGVTALLWIGMGLAVRALVLDGQMAPLAAADAAAPAFLQQFVHPVLAGVVFAALLAAIMSTADGFLNVGTAALVHDLPVAITGRSLPNEVGWARIIGVVLAAVAAAFALYVGDLVALLGAFGYGTFAAALFPVVAIGLNWKRATARAATVAIAVSILINFGVKIGGVTMPLGLDVGAVSLAVSTTLFIVVSLLDSPDPIPKDVAEVMEI